MARREDHHRHQQQGQLHYATILPSNASSTTPATNGNSPHKSPVIRKQTELERAKAVRTSSKSIIRLKSHQSRRKTKNYVCFITPNDEIVVMYFGREKKVICSPSFLLFYMIE